LQDFGKKTVSRLLLCLLAFAGSSLAGDGDELDEAFARDVLVVEASRFACYRIDIYLAVSQEQQRRGLMFVRELPERTGMLFVYEHANVVSMWMKNTYVPLDMVFARRDGTVASVAHNAEPLSLRVIPSKGPVVFVLELNAGIAAKLGIDENSRIFWGPLHGDDG
jgi:uncharacterized protein